jgi:hypothetical protein
MNRYSWAYAIGWTNKVNFLSWAQWSKRTWGVTVASLHEHLVYGLDRGYWYSPTGAAELPQKATDPFSIAQFFMLEEPTDTGRRAFANCVKAGEVSANVFQYVYAMTANPKSFMTSDYDHAVYWGSRGFFEGDIQPDGTLKYEGIHYDWRLADKSYIVADNSVGTSTNALKVEYVEPTPEPVGVNTDGIVEFKAMSAPTVLPVEPAPIPAPAPAPTPVPSPTYINPFSRTVVKRLW